MRTKTQKVEQYFPIKKISPVPLGKIKYKNDIVGLVSYLRGFEHLLPS